MPENIATKLIQWQAEHGRHGLPWQKKSPYHVWLSEVMLQQTQVKTVIPYFTRFIQSYPTVTRLAKASLEDVLRLWSGLGYYRRARYLHQSAQIIEEQHQGVIPHCFDTLTQLPGIGPSTAGAILSLGFKLPFAILDGNVKRLLARLYNITTPINDRQTEKQLWQLSRQLVPPHQADSYTQSVMDMGAIICTQTKPACSQCPITQECMAHHANTVDQIPKKIKKTKQKLTLIYHIPILWLDRYKVLLQKRPSQGIWADLFCPPIFHDETSMDDWLQQYHLSRRQTNAPIIIEHALTHRNLVLNSHVITLDKNEYFEVESAVWSKDCDSYPLPAPIKKLINRLNHECTTYDTVS